MKVHEPTIATQAIASIYAAYSLGPLRRHLGRRRAARALEWVWDLPAARPRAADGPVVERHLVFVEPAEVEPATGRPVRTFA